MLGRIDDIAEICPSFLSKFQACPIFGSSNMTCTSSKMRLTIGSSNKCGIFKWNKLKCYSTASGDSVPH